MNNQEHSYQYNDVNKEIQNFLSSRESKPHTEAIYKHDQQDILPLLESLNRTYNEINTALKTENSAALKDVILKSDVKMSLVCETLLETLRKTVEDKNKLIKENQELDKARRDNESREFSNKLLIDKLRNDIEFKKVSLDEVNRIVQDQKSRMNEFKEESFKSRNECAFFKAKIDELENLRNRANERMLVYEKELEALGSVIQEKDGRLHALITEKRDEENKNLNIKTRIAEIESVLENMNKKMEVKDRNLSLCNSELSKVLCENKKMKSDYEKYKESSGYYEGLYNSLNAQNSYLNAQLNKMLKNTEYSKDIDTFITKYKKKLKKAKRKVKKLEEDKNTLKEKVEDSICNDSSDLLIKKIEDLNSKNEKYQSQIDQLEGEKKNLEIKMKNLTIGDNRLDFKERAKSILNKPDYLAPIVSEPKSFPEFNKPSVSNFNSKYGNKPTVPTFKSTYGDYNKPSIPQPKSNDDHYNKIINSHLKYNDDNYSNLQPNYNEINIKPTLSTNYSQQRESITNKPDNEHYRNYEQSNRYAYQHPDNTYLKLFNLETDYDDKKDQIKKVDDLAGGFIQDGDIAPPKLNLNYSESQPKQWNNSSKPIAADSVKLTSLAQNPKDYETKQQDYAAFNDDESVESVKTYHTTSTLKEMMAKTDQLVKKFSDLEGKLEQFKEGETVDKLTDKLKTYNSYYSDWNVESNESDYI